MPGKPSNIIKLPRPARDGGVSIEKALRLRRSSRAFTGEPVELADMSQLLWSAQGVTDSDQRRTAPSAGATYPVHQYLVAGNVDGLDPGVYAYQPETHVLLATESGDLRIDLARASFSQSCVETCAALGVLTADFERTTAEYGKSGVKYVHFEIGHAAQNVLLQAVGLGLGAVVVGAFESYEVARCLALPESQTPLYMIAVGNPR